MTEAAKLRASGLGFQEIADKLGVSLASAYSLVQGGTLAAVFAESGRAKAS